MEQNAFFLNFVWTTRYNDKKKDNSVKNGTYDHPIASR